MKYKLKANIKLKEKSFLIFNIWTSNIQSNYIAILISYINSNSKLIYKLIAFYELKELEISTYLYNKVISIINIYLNINYKNIMRYIISFLFSYIFINIY